MARGDAFDCAEASMWERLPRRDGGTGIVVPDRDMEVAPTLATNLCKANILQTLHDRFGPARLR